MRVHTMRNVVVGVILGVVMTAAALHYSGTVNLGEAFDSRLQDKQGGVIYRYQNESGEIIDVCKDNGGYVVSRDQKTIGLYGSVFSWEDIEEDNGLLPAAKTFVDTVNECPIYDFE